MAQILKQIMAEYDAAKEDGGWDEGHPIFQLAEENDRMKNALTGIANATSYQVGLNDIAVNNLKNIAASVLKTM